MKRCLLFFALILATGLTSCASDENLTYRLRKRNDEYIERQERREMRKEARNQRYNAWFDRVMN